MSHPKNMKDSQILSGFREWPVVRSAKPTTQVAPSSRSGHAGWVLRCVLVVQALVMVAALFEARSVQAWLSQVGLLTGASLPALMAWMLALLGVQAWRPRLGLTAQWGVALGLGVAAGAYACALVFWMGLIDWAPWLASAASGALVAAGLTAMLHWRQRAELPAAARARLDTLQASIRPHFLFNTLNSAVALVRHDPTRAERMLEDLSELFRVALADRAHAVSLAEELALARHYLDIETVRFGERLRVDWRIDDSVGHALLPPLLLQPLVENAVKHGVEPSLQGADVRITARRDGDRVVLKVTNTVPGGRGQTGHGMALDNVRQRLLLLHDVHARFEWACQDGVFQVRMEWPLPSAGETRKDLP